MNRPEPEPAKQAPAKSKARQVANVVAEQESSAVGQGSGTVTLSDQQFKELLKAAKNGKTIILVAHLPDSELVWCDQIIKNF